jgi:nifR3 family TIM-barrel protein
LRIGDLRIASPAVQAALSGYSDLAMRRVARAHGARYALHEVVLDQTVLTRGRLQREILDLPPDDHPVGGQLMGADPADFGRAARLLAAAGYDVIDLNFGCPVPKVLGRCRGGYLCGDPPTALAMVDAVLDAVGGERPVTVKMRRGLDLSPESERAFFTILDGAFARGVAAVTVHPRTVVQRYEGPSDWNFLARVKRAVGDRVLLGSGDLFSAGDVLRMLAGTGVDGVTVARGAIGNPFVFRQVDELLAGRPARAPSIGEQALAIRMHLREALALYGPRGLVRARTHAIKYAGLHPEPVAVRDAFVGVRTEAGFEQVLARHYPVERADERAADSEDQARHAQRLRSCGVAGGFSG